MCLNPDIPDTAFKNTEHHSSSSFSDKINKAILWKSSCFKDSDRVYLKHQYYSFSKHLWKASHEGAIFGSEETTMRKCSLGLCFDIALNLGEKTDIE